MLVERVLDLNTDHAEDGAGWVTHDDPAVQPFDLVGAQALEACHLGVDVVGLDVEVNARRGVAGRLDHELDPRRNFAELVILRELL